MVAVQTYVTSLLMGMGIMSLVLMAETFIIVWGRKDLWDKFKLRRLIWMGYGIVEYISSDRTSQLFVKKINQGEIELPDGNHPVSEEATILQDRRYPKLTYREGEPLPITFDKIYEEFQIACKKCKSVGIYQLLKRKTINTKVLDNIVLRAKSEGGLMKWFKEVRQIFMVVIVGVAVSIVTVIALVWLIRNMPDIFAKAVRPLFEQYCKPLVEAATSNIAAVVAK